MLWTACPDAPFNKLSMQEMINQFIAVFFQVNQTFIGIYYLFEIYVFINDVDKRIFGIIFLIHAYDLFQCYFCFHYQSGKDAAGEIAAIRDKINFRIKTVLELFQRLLDFRNVLVFESFVYTHIVVTPAEMTGCTGFYSRSRASCNGVYHYVLI